MPTYYPQEAGDVVICVLVFLAAVFGLAAWLADRYDVRNPLNYDDEGDFHPVPDQAEIAAQHCAKVNAKRAAIENLPDDYLCPISGLTGAQFKAIHEQVARVQP